MGAGSSRWVRLATNTMQFPASPCPSVAATRETRHTHTLLAGLARLITPACTLCSHCRATQAVGAPNNQICANDFLYAHQAKSMQIGGHCVQQISLFLSRSAIQF